MFSVSFNRKTYVNPSSSAGKLRTSTSSNLLNKTHLYNLPKIPSYYKINRPSLSPQIRRNIQQKLSLDKRAEIQLKKRERSKDYFLNYRKNPFSKQIRNAEVIKKSKEKMLSKNKTQVIFRPNRDKIHQNLIQAVNSFRDNSPISKDQTLKIMRKEASKISSNIKDQIKHIKYGVKAQKAAENLKIQSYKCDDMDFDKIIKIEEESYYIQHQASINIFAFVKSPPKILNNSILTKYYFNFNSMVQKAEQNIRFPLYRDISRKARKTSLRNKFSKEELMQFIFSQDICSNIKKIRFQDMLGIASGRCTSELVYDWINNTDQNNKFSGQGKGSAIFLKENTQNANTNWQQPQQLTLEVNQWSKNVTQQFTNYVKKCKNIKSNIEYKMAQKVDLAKRTMFDEKAHTILTEQIKRDILYFLGKKTKPPTKTNSRFGAPNAKLTETKARTIKNQELMLTMKTLKNRFNNMQSLGNKTARI